MSKIIFLQLNELNFSYVEKYTQLNYLPNFKKFFDRHGYILTDSENKHELANPWIQWPTVHTGLDFADHGVFRLGDILKTDHPHIYEVLEQHGLRVAAISPFNAKNNTHNSAFFVPDPWTKTNFVGSWSLRAIYDALVQVADDYASNQIKPKSIFFLALGALDNIQWKNFSNYLLETFTYLVRNKRWYRALICDRLLADTFLTQWQRHQPDFATVFLNGAAHLQHHYLFSSRAYEGPHKNPDWHVPKGNDPLLDILKVYDQILGDIVQVAGNNRLMIATGLHQAPHERTTYYYRLNNQAELLDRAGIKYNNTYRLMTEDFVVSFPDNQTALSAQNILKQVKTVGRSDIFYLETGDSDVRTMNTSAEIFHIENRGKDLYLQLKPTKCEFPENVSIMCGDIVVDDNFKQLISFAQYKNTHHVGTGYFADSNLNSNNLPARFPLKNIFQMILDAFHIKENQLN